MKHAFRLALLAFVLTAILPFAAQAAPVDMKFSVSYNPKAQPESPHVIAVLKFKEELERLAPGKVNIRIFWDDQLAKTHEAAVNALKNGLIHFTQIPNGALFSYSKGGVPLSNLFLVPYPHSEIAYQAIDGKAGDMMRERVIKDSGLRIVGFWEVGFRHLTSVKKPINNLADLQGMKIRVQPVPVHVAAFKALGANPASIAWGELFTALQQGVVDGAENPFENIVDARLYEVQKHIALSGHAFEFVNFVTSEKFYQGLPADVRKAWDEAAAIATKTYRDAMKTSTEKRLAFLKTKMTVTELSPTELQKFRDATLPSRSVAAEVCGKEYHDAMMAEFDRITKEYLAKQGK